MDRRAGWIWGEFPHVSLTGLQVTSNEFYFRETGVFILILLFPYQNHAVCVKGVRGL